MKNPFGGRRRADAPDAQPEADEPVLVEASVVLAGSAGDRDAAIDEAGGLLVAAGAADPAYVAAMHERERSTSTHMGNGLALPHGTSAAKDHVRRTQISFVRYSPPVDWDGAPAEFVVGIAGSGKEHLALISTLARVFTDDTRVERLRTAATPADVLGVLDEVRT